MAKPITNADRLARQYKKALTELVNKIEDYLGALDKVMEAPSTPDRGKKVAALSNGLEMAKDTTKRFVLGV